VISPGFKRNFLFNYLFLVYHDRKRISIRDYFSQACLFKRHSPFIFGPPLPPIQQILHQLVLERLQFILESSLLFNQFLVKIQNIGNYDLSSADTCSRSRDIVER